MPHVCVKIDTALEMLKKGKNIFDVPAQTAMKDLMEAKSIGKIYFTGCDNENAEGRCLGHTARN